MKKLYTALILAGAALTASPQLTAQTTDMPYEISFTSSNYNTWTAVDDNKYPSEANWKNLAWMWNNNSWWYSLTSAGKEASDDWVISPAFAISEGTQYEITYRIDRYTGDKIEATLELVDGLESPKGLQTIDTWEINADKGKGKTVTFTASTSGNLRFGIHCPQSAVEGHSPGRCRSPRGCARRERCSNGYHQLQDPGKRCRG